MRPLQSAISLLIVAASCAGQATPPAGKKPVPKSHTVHSQFTCPDSEAQQACKSYSELLGAKDSGLKDNDFQDTGYACFRKQVDEFFVVTFSKPSFQQTWDKDRKKFVIAKDAQQVPGTGWIQTYKDGVADSGTMPYLFFTGNWRPLFGYGLFASDTIDFEPEPGGKLAVVSINDTQLSVSGYKYKSKLDANMEYNLTMQRSTRRFSESFVQEGTAIPVVEKTGRCVSR